MTAFYDRLRATGADFFAYADFFAFHVGQPRGSLRKLDVFPEHKEPVVPDEAEAILPGDQRPWRHPPARTPGRNLGDARARHAPQRPPADQDGDRLLAGRRVESPDIEITAAARAEQFVTAMLGHPRDLAGEDGRARETFRRLALDDALAMLQTGPEAPAQ